MATVTIRVPAELHPTLQRLAKQRGVSIGEVVAEAARRLDDDEFFAATNRAYARLLSDPTERAAFEAELAVWDTALEDGLEEFPWEE